jgi:hypothetical protein
MKSHTIIKRFAVGLAVLVASQLIWDRTPVARGYHRLVATCAQSLYGRAIAHGSIPDVHVDSQEFVVSVGGPKHEKLHVGALDITGNLCVLLALFCACPPRGRWRAYLLALAGAFAVLFVLHVAGLYVIIRTALAWHAGLDANHSEGMIADLGPWMYPLVVLLWVPRLLLYRRDVTTRPG